MLAMVAISVEPIAGSAMAAAIHQGYGEDFILAYLASKMPAGSPVEILRVARIPDHTQGAAE